MINLGRVSEFSSRPRAFQIPSWRERAANQALGWSTYRHNEYANRPAFGYICFNELRNGGGSFGGGTLIKVLSGGLKSLKNKGPPRPPSSCTLLLSRFHFHGYGARMLFPTRDRFPPSLPFSTPPSSSSPLFQRRTRWNVHVCVQDLRVIDG